MNPMPHNDIVHPTHCFCQVSMDDLTKWAVKRYYENVSTTDLLKSTDDPYEKEVISIVSLLDIDDKTMFALMGDVNKPEHHIIHCRENVLDILKEVLKRDD